MEQKWLKVIEPKTGLLDLKLKEVWRYKDLIMMFVKRNFSSQYKQTVLGPLWFLIQPFITTVLFTIVFGNIANIPTDGVPQFIFYMAGNTAWLYFSTCLTSTANTFVGNAAIFGKVYFPRLTMPIASVIFALITFGIQFAMFIGFLIYYVCVGSVNPNITILYLPLYILQMAMLGLGFGIIISSLTTKYRDLTVLVSFGVQLWMYITPIVYPISKTNVKMYKLIMLNPMASVINNFRYSFLGCGNMEYKFWIISWIVTCIILFIGVVIFNKVEKTFMDTV